MLRLWQPFIVKDRFNLPLRNIPTDRRGLSGYAVVLRFDSSGLQHKRQATNYMGMFDQAQDFVSNFKEGVLHPFSKVENRNADTKNENSIAAQVGHAAGQLTDLAAVGFVAHKLPFLKGAKGLLPDLEIQGAKGSGEAFLHAPATFAPRNTSIERALGKRTSSLLADIHIPDDYSVMTDASHAIESTHVEPTTYKMTKPGNPREFIEKTEPFKYYKLKGVDAKIGLPLQFADSLEPIRSARLKSSQLDGFQRDLFDTKRSASLRGYDSAILPEQIPMFLRELPNPSLAKEVLLIPQADAKAGAAVDRDYPGRIQLFDFKKFLDPYIDTAEAPFYFRHEWSHLAEPENKSLATAFRVARTFEKKGFFAHETAIDCASEDWAVHMGENLMDPDSSKFLETIKKAPMRSLVLLQSLKQQLAEGALAMESRVGADGVHSVFAHPMSNPYASQLNARVELGEQMLLPEVKKILQTRLNEGQPGWKVLSRRYASLLRQNGVELLSSD